MTTASDDFIPRDIMDAQIEVILAIYEGEDDWTDQKSGSEAESALADWMKEQPFIRNYRAEARVQLDRFSKRRRSKRKPGQEVLFDPGVYYPDGNGKLVKATKAKKQHLVTTLAIRTEAHLQEEEDFVEDRRYLRSRISKFMSDDETLLSLEIREFGWQDENDVDHELDQAA